MICPRRLFRKRGRWPARRSLGEGWGAPRLILIFENPSEFVRTQSTVLDNWDCWGGRSHRPPPLRAPQSQFCTGNQGADSK